MRKARDTIPTAHVAPIGGDSEMPSRCKADPVRIIGRSIDLVLSL
jgi:hypothetical protein